jgi:hypothetical protein
MTDSYATGTVTGNGSADVGGLVGINYMPIINSYATGVVKVNNSPDADVGGLVGYNSGAFPGGSISGSFAIGAVTATNSTSAYVGGLVGLNDQDGAITNSYTSTGAVTGGRDEFVGGLVGGLTNGATVADSYSAGAVTGGKGSETGGLVGSDGTGGITDSYWDTTTSGITNLSQGAGNVVNDTGITGLTTGQLQSGLPTGFDPAIWGGNATINGGLPYLLALPPS